MGRGTKHRDGVPRAAATPSRSSGHPRPGFEMPQSRMPRSFLSTYCVPSAEGAKRKLLSL